MSDGSGPSFLGRWFAPWSQWQQADSARSSPLHAGIAEYRDRGVELAQPTYRELVQSHQPGAIFLSCSDARVVPHQITMAGPGDLFVIRNVGNLIPHDDSPESSVAGALEYAIDVMKIPELMICGHSGCGAMRALSGQASGGQDALARWLAAAQPTLDRWNSGAHAGDAGRDPVDQLGMLNAAQQVQNALTLPFVRSAVESGRLRINAAFFDVGSASLALFDPQTGRFPSVGTDRRAG